MFLKITNRLFEAQPFYVPVFGDTTDDYIGLIWFVNNCPVSTDTVSAIEMCCVEAGFCRRA
jgi:hypothetical protein